MSGSQGSDGDGLSPVVRRFTVQRPCDRAFTAFTEGTGNWWPSDFTASGTDHDGGR
jgi:hypothetical protein